jgi:feruloyl-CoA synthase
VFDGRVAEDFKLATGTWVSVGPMRARAIAAFAPFARDVVLTGLNRDDLAAILIPDVDACRAACPELAVDTPLAAVLADAGLRPRVSDQLARLAQTATGSATRIFRVAFLSDPPSIDVGEITDKGSINQRAVLRHRTALVEDLYSDTPAAHVITLDR